MICPQLVHFVVATMAICFESLDHLRMYTCLLYTLEVFRNSTHFCTHGWLNFFRDILYIRFGWIAPRRTSFVFGFAAAMFETCCGLCLCVPNLASFSALHLICYTLLFSPRRCEHVSTYLALEHFCVSYCCTISLSRINVMRIFWGVPLSLPCPSALCCVWRFVFFDRASVELIGVVASEFEFSNAQLQLCRRSNDCER